MFNDYFINVFQLTGSFSPDDISFPLSIVNSVKVDENKVINLISKLNANSAMGPDNLGNSFYIKCKNELSKSICFIFRTFLNKGLYPKFWKVSKVVPIFKEGDKKSVENYRPISLLCNISKIFERLLFDEIYSHVEHFLHQSQFGFRKKRSAVLQLLCFLDQVSKCDDDKSANDLIVFYIDFQKAFDKVPHKPIEKIRNLGFGGKLLGTIAIYLQNRHQFVNINGISFKVKQITSSVPQGSIIGPLLFLIYFNDLPDAFTDSLSFGYADDFKFLSTDAIFFTSDLLRLEYWCEENHMSLNLDKCVTNLNFKGNQTFCFCGLEMKNALSHKDLGVIISKSLNWKDNCDNRLSKATRSFFFLKRNMSQNSSGRTKLNAYCGYIVPILSYASQVWYANKNELRLIEKLQKRAFKWILGESSDCYSTRCKKLKILPLSLYIEMHDLLFFLCVTKGKYDIDNDKYIQISSASLETRQPSRGDFKLPCLSKHRSQHNFWYRGALLFNLFGQHIDLISYDVQAIKLEPTKLYWKYVNQRYTENNLCTWRILCFCDNCNNYGKLTDLSTEG